MQGNDNDRDCSEDGLVEFVKLMSEGDASE